MPEYLKTADEFRKALKDAGNKWVVVDFTASWCPPCKMIAPIFETLSKEFTEIKFYKVDVDENNETAEDQGIQAMPTFKFYQNEKAMKTMKGADEKQLKSNLEECK
ncbi:thioredoxin-like [Halichondria panicea]|uniref:thioredoxin-like n=1 Tax=Halichondria panicea TaxID=6063 RepID=UPI00312B57A4